MAISTNCEIFDVMALRAVWLVAALSSGSAVAAWLLAYTAQEIQQAGILGRAVAEVPVRKGI